MKNELRIAYYSVFDEQIDVLPPEIIQAFRDALALYLIEASHPALRNHPLHGKFAGYRSIDVTDDHRAILRETQTGEGSIITFYKIGTHKQLYG